MTTARPGRRARYFYDCEFIEDGRTIDLVSIGIVCDDGREYYALSSEFDPTRAGPWVAAHVLPHLPRPSDESWRPRSAIRDEVLAFLTEPGLPIELWAWCAAYDHVARAAVGRYDGVAQGHPAAHLRDPPVLGDGR